MTKQNKENRDNARNNDTKSPRKWLAISIIAIAAVVITGLTMAYPFLSGTQTQAQARDASLGEVLDSISPISAQAIVVKEKLTSIEGVSLSEVAKSTLSKRTEEINGKIDWVSSEGQAEISILKSDLNPATGDTIIAFQITNTGKESFKIVDLGLEGQTKSGYIPMQVLAVSEQNEKPNVTIRDAVLLNPGESLTGHVVGKWTAAGINEDITEFQAGAVYRYEDGDSVKVWTIGTDLYSLS